MAVDIGAEATDRPSQWQPLYTTINKAHPATANGTITSIDVWAQANITGLRVGIFYATNGNTFKCRSSVAIAGTITAGSKVTKVVSLAVLIGDYIGCYFATGWIERDLTGYLGFWQVSGEYIDVNDETEYTLLPDDEVSLGGYFAVVGWTGKISGVTNPAKIMGVDVANIAKVKGVVSS